MKIELSWALGFKLFTILYGMGLIGSMLLPSHERTEEPKGDQHPVLEDPVPQAANSKAAAMPTAASEPMTRAVLESIYFDVVQRPDRVSSFKSSCKRTTPDQTEVSFPVARREFLDPLFSPLYSMNRGEGGLPITSRSATLRALRDSCQKAN